jgi:hypothetical protein
MARLSLNSNGIAYISAFSLDKPAIIGAFSLDHCAILLNAFIKGPPK